MATRRVIVFVLDGWSANFLGPYGNTWVETSTLNRLARDGLLIQYALTDTPELMSVYSSYWQGRHATCPPNPAAASIGDLLAANNLRTHLITDEPLIARHPLAARNSSVTFVELPMIDHPATDPTQTQFAQFLASVTETLEQETADCLWIHARAFSGAWDAPYSLRLALSDEEDPDPPRLVLPPDAANANKLDCDESGEIGLNDEDPDIAWGLARAYAAQVMTVDRCLEFFFDVLDRHPYWGEALLLLTSPRGFPLGEHRQTGLAGAPLFGELLHIPMILRRPDEPGVLLRSQALAQPPSVFATVLDWLNIERDQRCTGARSLLPLFSAARCVSSDGANKENQRVEQDGFDRCVSVTLGEQSLRTPGWFLRNVECAASDARQADHTDKGTHKDTAEPTLYVKPDDRWEANEVADRCQSIVELMNNTLKQFIAAADRESLDELPALETDVLKSES